MITKDDGETGYFSSNRKPGSGSDDIYSFSLVKKVIEVIVYDFESSALVPNAEVRLFDAEIERNRSVTAPDGSSDVVLNPKKNYVIKVSKNDYAPSEGKLESNMFMKENFFQIRVPLVKQMASTAPELDSTKSILAASDDMSVKGTSSGVVLSQEGKPSKNSTIKIYHVVNRTGIQEIALKDNTVYLYDKEQHSLMSKTGQILVSLKEPMPMDLYQRQQLIDEQLNKLNISAQYQLQSIQNIYYDYSKDHIRKDASAILDNLVNLIKDYPELSVRLTSHTDSRGNVVYNQSLSKRRVDSAKTYLINKGIESSRIEVNWLGKDKLVNNCGDNQNCDEVNHQFNRRTEITLFFN